MESEKRNKRRRIQKKAEALLKVSSGEDVHEHEDDSFNNEITFSNDNLYTTEKDCETEEDIFDSDDYDDDNDSDSNSHFSDWNTSEDDELDSSFQETNSLPQNLANWVSKHEITREATNELLSLLLKHGMDVPKDKRTLCKTPRNIEVVDKSGGKYFYLGIENGVTKAIKHLKQFSQIDLSVNIDGLPLCRSSKSQLWPILGSINNSSFIFAIAIFHSNSKPGSVNEYLEDFISEVQKLSLNGIVLNGINYAFRLKCFICDAPARAFLKCIIGHGGYHSCERCDIVGTRVQNRTVFNSATPGTRRTMEEFETGSYLGSHQRAISPLVDLGIDCINQFPLDYMHSILLGVLKRMLTFLIKGPKICRLSSHHISKISERLNNLNGNMPSEFNRQPRGLDELCYWKSTEYRQFLLYHGPVVLKGIVPDNVYQHFLALHISMSILLKEGIESSIQYITYAKELLTWFVSNSVIVFGESFCVYNVHCLLHIADDVTYFSSSLNEICAFKFENFMQVFKRKIRNSKNPVAQIVKRFAEEPNVVRVTSDCNKLHPTMKATDKDGCFLLKNGNICQLPSWLDEVCCNLM